MNRLGRHKESGFTLIEALIALLVVMIGLLGVAGMQALAIHNSTQAHIRSLASLDAHGLAAVIRSNHAFWTDITAAPGTVTISAAGATALPVTQDCAANSCTAAQSAAYSLNKWAQVLKDLPGATARITRAAVTSTAPSAYLVTVQWSEKNMMAKNQGVLAASSATSTSSTSVVVQP